MKASQSLLYGLLVSSWVFLFNGPLALGQSNDYYPKAVDKVKGYWNLKTDYDFHGTLIRFYSADSQLVYQESMPNQFIELNARNVRRLDRTLARLVDNQLVASSIPTSKLLFIDRKPLTPRNNLNLIARKSEPMDTSLESSFDIQSFAVPGKPSVHLLIANPTLDRLTVSILSSDNTTVYEHITHLAASRHHLDLAGMSAGTYQIRVKSSTQQYQQLVTLNYGQHEAIAQIKEGKMTPDTKRLISRK